MKEIKIITGRKITLLGAGYKEILNGFPDEILTEDNFKKGLLEILNDGWILLNTISKEIPDYGVTGWTTFIFGK